MNHRALLLALPHEHGLSAARLVPLAVFPLLGYRFAFRARLCPIDHVPVSRESVDCEYMILCVPCIDIDYRSLFVQCEAHMFLAGSIGDLVLTLAFIPILYVLFTLYKLMHVSDHCPG